MKKTLLLLSLLGSFSFSFAQSTTKFGIIGGLNLASLSSTSSGTTSNTSGLTAFHVGAFVDFSLSESVSIQPGVQYSMKGGTDTATGTYGSTVFTATEKITLNYVEVPVNVYYHISVDPGTIFLGGGPYLGWGLSGKIQVNGASGSSSSSIEQNATFGSNSGDIKNPDYGVNLGAGITFKNNFLAKVGYGLGIANLSNDSGSTLHNGVFSISVGYSFK